MFWRFFLLLCFVNANICIGQNCLDEILRNKLYSGSNDIVNGRKWINEKKYLGTPLLITEYWPKADIFYNGVHYSGQMMNYDLDKDEMIIYLSEKDKLKFVTISNEKLTSFTFTDTVSNKKHIYEYTELPCIKGRALYENVSAGKILFYIKQIKKVELRLKGEGSGEYSDHFEYYLNSVEGFTRITSKRQLLKLLPDYGTELKRYMRNHGSKISEKHPENIIDLVHYCNSLN
jgi:hypothetical protein